MKPHIYFRDGYWRVTWMPPKRQRKAHHYIWWSQAHEFVCYLNNKGRPCSLNSSSPCLV